jgi:hypothetical protein
MLTNLKLTPLPRLRFGLRGQKKTRAQQQQQQQAHPRALCRGRSQSPRSPKKSTLLSEPFVTPAISPSRYLFARLRSSAVLRSNGDAASSNVTRMYALRSGAPNELRNGSYKHGSFTCEAIAEPETTRDLIQTVRALRLGR